MRAPWRAFAIVGLACATVSGAPVRIAFAQERPQEKTGAPSQDPKILAQEHFTRARELYQTGDYRDAVKELESAYALDPTGKDLIFNLGVVSEKLDRIDDALRYFHKYLGMDITAVEQKRAESYIRRLEGAKKTGQVLPTPTSTVTQDPPPPPQREERRVHGRIDAATVTAFGIGVIGVGVGVGFGIKAMGDQPKAGFVTGRDGTYADLQNKTDTAHKEAQIADIGFAVGAAGVITSAILYFAREKDRPAPKVEGRARVTSILAQPISGGASFGVGGEF